MDDERVERLARLYSAVAEPARLRILGMLAEDEATGTELSARLGLTPATISHHMAKLVDVGLVTVTPDAQRRVYRLERTALHAPLASAAPPAETTPRDEAAKVLRDFFDGERLKHIPAARKKRVVVLRHLLERFAAGRDYTEREVNDLLRPAHADVATLRRELVDYGFMSRESGRYRVATGPPPRGATVAQEVGPDEAAWFAAALARATERALRERRDAGLGERQGERSAASGPHPLPPLPIRGRGGNSFSRRLRSDLRWEPIGGAHSRSG